MSTWKAALPSKLGFVYGMEAVASCRLGLKSRPRPPYRSPMVEIVYVSAAVTPLSEAHLGVLLSRARSSNALLGVTGMLLYDRGSFMQVIEGSVGAVDWLFEKIGKDSRHHRVTKLSRTRITARSFDRWSMGYVSVEQQRTAQLAGFSDLFGASFSVASFLEKPASKKLRDFLLAFRSGRFHNHVGSA